MKFTFWKAWRFFIVATFRCSPFSMPKYCQTNIEQFGSPEYDQVFRHRLSVMPCQCVVSVCIKVCCVCVYQSVLSLLCLFVSKCVVSVCIKVCCVCVYQNVLCLHVSKCVVSVCIKMCCVCMYQSVLCLCVSGWCGTCLSWHARTSQVSSS